MNVTFPTTGKNERYPKGSVIQGWGENVPLYLESSKDKQTGKSTITAGHPGIDILPDVGYGQPVFSPTDGTVVATVYSPNGYGHEVAILSDETQDGYHLNSVLAHLTEQQVVQVGDKVKAGQTIGFMGNSGFVVSNGSPFWGNSNPDKKGTHTHWRTQWLKEVLPGQPSNTSCLNKNYLIKDYGNGCDNSFNPETLFSMNQAKVVKSKTSNTVYICWPVPDMDYLKKATDLQGIPLPTTIPNTDTL